MENAHKVNMQKKKRLSTICAELCKVLSPTASFSEMEKHRKITAQEILIADVWALKI